MPLTLRPPRGTDRVSADASIRLAWGQIPSPGEVGSELERFAGRRMDRIIAIVVGVGSLALGVQALLAALGGMQKPTFSHYLIIMLVFVPWALMLITCVIGRGMRVAAGVFASTYLIVLLLWPFVAIRVGADPTDQPWIFYLVNVAGTATVVAFPLVLQVAWVFIGPLLYGAVRLIQGGFQPEFWITTAFDVSFTLILGGVLVALGWMFRSVAAGVDDARGRAVASYADAASAAALEEERVAVAALMHDSVLAALISAERAHSDRERDLAVGMAREALTRLANAEASTLQEGNDTPVQIERIVDDLCSALADQDVAPVVEQFGTGVVPDRVARAIALAARQAIGNAAEHAQARGLEVIVEGHGDTGLTVKVSDRGDGFDPDEVPADRLGIRGSILARMAAVGGTAAIESGADGTTVTLGWSAR